MLNLRCEPNHRCCVFTGKMTQIRI
jgi:hypothetical protein